MKKLAAVITLSALSTFSFAQEVKKMERVSPEKKQELKMQKMEAELDLTPEQKKQVDAVNQKYGPIEKVQKEKMTSLKKEMKTTRDAKHEEIKLILTPEQLKTMEEKKAAKKEHMEHKKQHIKQRNELPKK
jgi:Spy/CpxP family protein refolding chaperone